MGRAVLNECAPRVHRRSQPCLQSRSRSALRMEGGGTTAVPRRHHGGTTAAPRRLQKAPRLPRWQIGSDQHCGGGGGGRGSWERRRRHRLARAGWMDGGGGGSKVRPPLPDCERCAGASHRGIVAVPAEGGEQHGWREQRKRGSAAGSECEYTEGGRGGRIAAVSQQEAAARQRGSAAAWPGWCDWRPGPLLAGFRV